MDDHIQFNRIRPRIYVETSLTKEEIDERIKKYLGNSESRCKGLATNGYATFYPPQKEQHFWSPQLTITYDSEDDKTTYVRGLYGPRPSVWTMFVFFYAAVAFAILIVSMVGLSYWTLDKPITFLWMLPVLSLMFLSIFLVAYFGQKLGQKQMTNLHRVLEHCLSEKIDPI